MRLLYFLALQSLCVSLRAQPASEPVTNVAVEPVSIVTAATIEPETILGGLIDVNVSNPDVKTVAAFALWKINSLSPVILELRQIVRAQTQVVRGINYYLHLEVTETNRSSTADAESNTRGELIYRACTVTVFNGFNLTDTQITYENCTLRSERRRRTTDPGGLADADVNEEGVKSAAGFALAEVDKRSNSAYKQALVQILSAKKQVVAGTLYHLQLEVSESSCRKGSSKADSECSLREGLNSQVCSVKVLERPWLNKWEVAQLHCSAKS